MSPAELLRWQWENYPVAHRDRVNLLLHLGTVPLFWAGTVLLLEGVARLGWSMTVAGVACLLLPMLVQGVGHKRLEATPPAPFTSPWNFLARLFLEQWITFPRYVLSGGWYRAFRDAA